MEGEKADWLEWLNHRPRTVSGDTAVPHQDKKWLARIAAHRSSAAFPLNRYRIQSCNRQLVDAFFSSWWEIGKAAGISLHSTGKRSGSRPQEGNVKAFDLPHRSNKAGKELLCDLQVKRG